MVIALSPEFPTGEESAEEKTYTNEIPGGMCHTIGRVSCQNEGQHEGQYTQSHQH